VNYLLLRWQKRLHAAWITIPLITIVFSIGAFSLGYVLRGTNLILNKIAIIELPLASIGNNSAPTTSYLGLFSPSQQSYEIEVKSDNLLSPLTQDYAPWNTPMNPNSVSINNSLVFVQGQPSQVRGLSVEQWSMQSFMTEGVWTNFGRINSDLWLKPEGLVGTLRNETAYTLEDATLIMSSQFIRLGNLPAGTEVPVTLKPATDLSALRYGPAISYRLFGDTYQSSLFGQPNRENELKRAMVDSLPQSSGGLSSGLSVSKSGVYATQPQSAYLVGWFHEAPLEVKVKDRSLVQQTTAMVYAPLPYHFPMTGLISLPAGLLMATLVKTPENGGSCSPFGASVWMDKNQAVFEFQLPDEIQGIHLENLELVLGTDGSLGQVPGISVYNWKTETWKTLSAPIFGTNILTEVGSLVDKNGIVRIQISMEGWSGPGGCIYVDMGVEGKR
jgi:hypothetical protein